MLPWQWLAILRGWPGLRTHGLAALANKFVNGSDPAGPEASAGDATKTKPGRLNYEGQSQILCTVKHTYIYPTEHSVPQRDSFPILLRYLIH